MASSDKRVNDTSTAASSPNNATGMSTSSLSFASGTSHPSKGRSGPLRANSDLGVESNSLRAEMASSRKRNAHSADDDTTPIINSPPIDTRNYNSISPSPTARSPGLQAAREEGTTSAQHEQPHAHQQRTFAEHEAAQQERREKSRWKQWVDKYGSVELENKGSVARDHLALERTFLAWLRTSLSFASIGIAVTQLFRLNTTIAADEPALAHSPQAKLRHVGKPLGATFIAIAVLILFIGFHRYFEAQHYVIRGKFPASRGSVLLVAGVAGALIVSSLVVILAVGTGRFEE